ncbi:hypothetical protein PSH03_005406 [Micromonospora sp. PSH03]|uniref:hypothetical protein n=1 Tax=Micromonospora salmantinae TaxID=2911211 RepID=UPI001EE95D25|nr:hypothetical protein [Micromonospora salmantinae]MCG5459622.1 hypothetical protein [Micromonospora salmantinae]
MSETVDIELNPDDLTLGDLEDFETYVGAGLDEAVKPKPVFDDDGNRVFDEKGRPVSQTRIPTKALVALVWLVKRRETAGFTIADARDVRVNSLVLTESDTADRGND